MLLRFSSKTLLLLAFFIFSKNTLQAQTWHFGIDLGIEKPYIIETIEEQKELKIGFAPAFLASLKYTPEQSKWGIKANFQYSETRAKGITKITQTPINGFISNSTFSLMAEKNRLLAKFPKWHFINAFGFGWSKENYVENAEKQARQNNYLNLIAQTGFEYAINEKVNFKISNQLIINDMVKGIHYLSGNWQGQSAGEDVALNLLFGLNFKLK